jgi:hypothetical protein
MTYIKYNKNNINYLLIYFPLIFFFPSVWLNFYYYQKFIEIYQQQDQVV